jgi:phosphomannomutase
MAASEPIISVSGLRGIVGTSLTPDLIVRFVAAYAAEQPGGSIVVTRDGRTSGPMVVDAVRATLAAAGRLTIDCGIAATPTTGVLVRQLGAVGGVQVSASHNPPQYNGLKLFDAQGRVLSAERGAGVLERYRRQDLAFVDYQRLGEVTRHRDTVDGHLQLVLQTVDVPRIREQSFSVLLDSNHGAGSLAGRRLLEELGCQLTLLGGQPDGLFDHPAEPTAENLADVCPRVPASGAAVGFCQDPDADRLAVIDEQGRYLGEEYTLALCLEHVLSQSPDSGAVVVINCATSRMAQDIAERHGARLLRSPVGEAHVVRRMLDENAVFGGEGNGGPIDPRVGYVRDSFVGMAQILELMAARRLPISRLADELPRYGIHKTTVALDAGQVPTALATLQAHFAGAQADLQDGLRLDWPDRWLLIRASNTEPIVRLIAEAATGERARELTDEAAGVLR